ncbi:VOC family protein [Oceanimonas marisflavi]|uniref:VOC family protein n=1 Tax=Oceanimonas marisflavi TaxID=2059724 RepID=UPI000D322BFD|nr:VOC family protein [Oceanimonas marisflavi]
MTHIHYPRLTHLALHVRDLDACLQFYHDFCGMKETHRRESGPQTIVWLAEPGRERDFVFVLMNGGEDLHLGERDYRHFGFALQSRAAVDALAERAGQAGCLLWPPRDEPFPVGYYCGVKDPNGNQVEFSFGQPLGPVES